jgi:hypothetical protein
MEARLSQRVGELVANGWEPVTTTETTASLVGRRPFAWWLFLIVIFLFPLFGGSFISCSGSPPRRRPSFCTRKATSCRSPETNG